MGFRTGKHYVTEKTQMSKYKEKMEKEQKKESATMKMQREKYSQAKVS